MVKFTGSVRQVDEMGRVVIPVEMRTAFDIESQDELEVLTDEDNKQIILQKPKN